MKKEARQTDAAWVKGLLGWFRCHQRAMPWRDHPDPYAVWISEMMLQQTQVSTVMPYFERFMARFPSVQALAKEALSDVLRLWEGLGYYARARNLHKAAGIIVQQHAGQLPASAAALQDLPGFGPYSAAAVASICFNEPVSVLDGNVMRVLARLLRLHGDVRRPAVRRKMIDYLDVHIPKKNPGGFNQAMMELGALVCRPRRPQCGQCPLAVVCLAFQAGEAEQLPEKKARKKTPVVGRAAVWVCRQDRVLVVRRGASAMLGGLWELPSVDILPGESPSAAAIRAARERAGVKVAIIGHAGRERQVYSHFELKLHIFKARRMSGRLHAQPGEAVQWLALDALDTLPFDNASRRVLTRLSKEL